eukprot:Sdes_comp21275_c0_seq1m19917
MTNLQEPSHHSNPEESVDSSDSSSIMTRKRLLSNKTRSSSTNRELRKTSKRQKLPSEQTPIVSSSDVNLSNSSQLLDSDASHLDADSSDPCQQKHSLERQNDISPPATIPPVAP